MPRFRPHVHEPMFLPSLCAVCRAWGRQRVCQPCVSRFLDDRALRCPRCAVRVPEGVRVCATCLRTPPAFDAAWTMADYRYPWSGFVVQLKFSQALELSGAMASIMGQALAGRDGKRPDLLLPVPLSIERMRQRGFNQAWELARRLARELKIDARGDALLRLRDTPHQLTLPRSRRQSNVRGAFAVEPSCRLRLAGRSVALVDDVMTTGATLGELARTVRLAGATRVEAWTFARTPPAGD